MSEIFLKIINMSISASYILLAVLLLRLLLRKAPKWITVLLWGMVAIRLVCPFSLESILSLIPSAEVVSPDIMMDQTPTINTGIPIINSTLNPVINESFTPNPGDSVNPLQIWIPVLAAIWVAGVVLLLVYTVFSYAKIKRRIGTAVLYRDNIYQSEKVASPFVLGIIKPKIYLPFSINESEMKHVIAHEMAHIRRKDHLWKPIGFLLLALHWFNPLMWVGYVLLCRDIELACDEKVIKALDHDARADYSDALLACSVNRPMIAACPLAFGEVGVKDRVKAILNYKKPAFWIILAALVACVVVAVCFLTNPPSDHANIGVIPSGKTFTDYEGVYVSVKSIDTNAGGHTVFNLIWNNTTKEEITYGEFYIIERKDGNNWVNTASKELYFSSIGLLLHPNSTENKSYSTQRFDISQIGTYRLRVTFHVDEGGGYKAYNTWIEFKVGSIPTTDSLREKYPEYFELDASKGLDVYVWQMAKDSYSFGLLPHAEQGRDVIAHELLNLRGTRAEEMSVILSTYSVDEDDIHIIPWHNPVSGYLGEWQILGEGEDTKDLDAKKQAYVESIRQMLFTVMIPTEPSTPQEPSPQEPDPPEHEEVRFDLFHTLLAASYTQKQEFVAEVYVQHVAISSWVSYNTVFENGEIYLNGHLHSYTYQENVVLEYSEWLLIGADDDTKQVLEKIKSKKTYYRLQDGKYFLLLCEIDNALFFLTASSLDGIMHVGRINAVFFDTVPGEDSPGAAVSFEDQLKQDLKKNGFFKKYADEELSFIFFAKTDRFCAFFVERPDGYTGNPSTFDIGGLKFHYANRQWIMVWCEGNTAWLEDAYNNRWLSQNELQAVYDGYLAVYPERKNPIIKDSSVAEPVGGPLSEEMQATISAAMQAKTGHAWTYKLQSGATYYGKFGDCYVIMDTPEMAADVVTTKNHLGYAFTFGRPFELYVYCNGEIYTLTEAINLGKLTQSDVEQLYQFHTTYNSTYSN